MSQMDIRFVKRKNRNNVLSFPDVQDESEHEHFEWFLPQTLESRTIEQRRRIEIVES